MLKKKIICNQMPDKCAFKTALTKVLHMSINKSTEGAWRAQTESRDDTWKSLHYFLVIFISYSTLAKYLSLWETFSFSFLAAPHNLWDLSPPTRDWTPGPRQWKCWVLTTGPQENSQETFSYTLSWFIRNLGNLELAGKELQSE